MVIQVSANNGQAPGSALAPMPGRNGDGSQQTSPTQVVASYNRLRAAMTGAGMGDLVPSSGWSCYRDRAAQQHMRDIGLTTIPVGQSIHGEWTFGGAVDFSNLGGFGAARHNWLRANAAGWGWYQPGWAQQNGSLPEPWHWEYDQRGDPHYGEEPEDMSFTDADRNMLANTNALLQETPFRAAQQVMAWQVSRVAGAPTTFLQDQTDGVTNTYTLVTTTTTPTTTATRWTPTTLIMFLLAVVLALLVIVSPFVLTLDADVQDYLGIEGVIAGALAALAAARSQVREPVERHRWEPYGPTYPDQRDPLEVHPPAGAGDLAGGKHVDP